MASSQGKPPADSKSKQPARSVADTSAQPAGSNPAKGEAPGLGAITAALGKQLLANLTANAKNPTKADKAREERDAKVRPSAHVPFGEGAESYHRSKALAHLDAAQAHATAAHSAKTVEAAGQHEPTVQATRDAESALGFGVKMPLVVKKGR